VKRDLIAVNRQILDALEHAELERAKDVVQARADVRVQLGQHGLFTASFATGQDPAASFLEFRAIASHMRAGGYHRVRLTGGRGIPERGRA
jgi:hypothetical protein